MNWYDLLGYVSFLCGVGLLFYVWWKYLTPITCDVSRDEVATFYRQVQEETYRQETDPNRLP